jgi:hypothetical protein
VHTEQLSSIQAVIRRWSEDPANYELDRPVTYPAENLIAYLDTAGFEIRPYRPFLNDDGSDPSRPNPKPPKPRRQHTNAQWVAMLVWAGASCVCCQLPFAAIGDPQRGHVVARINGGTDAIDNIQPMCRSCNSKQGTKTIDYRDPSWREAVL